MKNYGDLGGCYRPRPTASTENTFLDLHNSSYDTQPHSLINSNNNNKHTKCMFLVIKHMSISCFPLFCFTLSLGNI